jgi:hypothetical protein
VYCNSGSAGWYFDCVEVYKEERVACFVGRLYVIVPFLLFSVYSSIHINQNKIVKNKERINRIVKNQS